ncbi:hypothetical protein HCG60_10295 [Ligilactobacillus murinus]|nr:hypothetical protein [Ligilactobacillus murinus]MBX9013411.1 hypothetical protein [Ligilactobacillus murinus]
MPTLLEKIYFEEQDQTMLVLSTKQNFKGATAIVDGHYVPSSIQIK